MTIPKAMLADKAFCRRRHTWAMVRWRSKHRDHYNAYMARYMRGYRKQTRGGHARRGVMPFIRLVEDGAILLQTASVATSAIRSA